MNITKRLNFFRKYISNEIPFKLINSKKVYFPHPVGIVVSASACVGNNVTIFSNVIIGGKKHGGVMGYPNIEDDVTIFTGAVVVGNITIGRGSVVGAGAIVMKNVPPYSLVYSHKELTIRPLVKKAE